MTTGPGRNAHVADIPFIQDFFDGTIALPSGTYTKASLEVALNLPSNFQGFNMLLNQ